MSGVRVTGVQAAQVAIAQIIHGLRSQMAPGEYTILVDLLARFFAEEHMRVAGSPTGRRLLGDAEGGEGS